VNVIAYTIFRSGELIQPCEADLSARWREQAIEGQSRRSLSHD